MHAYNKLLVDSTRVKYLFIPVFRRLSIDDDVVFVVNSFFFYIFPKYSIKQFYNSSQMYNLTLTKI